MDFLIWKSYLTILIIIIFNIVLLIILYKSIFKKKSIINIQNVYYTKKEFVKKHLNIINLILQITFIALMAISLIIVYDNIIELPSVLKNEYKVVEIKTISKDVVGDYVKERSIKFIDLKNGHVEYLSTVSQPIKAGKCYQIHYYPNIRIGEIITEIVCKD